MAALKSLDSVKYSKNNNAKFKCNLNLVLLLLKKMVLKIHDCCTLIRQICLKMYIFLIDMIDP